MQICEVFVAVVVVIALSSLLKQEKGIVEDRIQIQKRNDDFVILMFTPQSTLSTESFTSLIV